MQMWFPATGRLLMLLCVLGIASSARADSPVTPCDPSDAAFVCGIPNSEDIVRLAGTPWIIASEFNLRPKGTDFVPVFGPLHAIAIDTRKVRRLFPAPGATIDWDREVYGDCPMPPQALSPHGLNVRPLGHGKFRLYVANNGMRESIEVFDIQAGSDALQISWRGCLYPPAGIQPNGVAPLNAEDVVVSGGHIAVWRRNKGWTEISGYEGTNGIEVSRDGKWLYCAVSGDHSVVRIPLESGTPQVIFKSDFYTDNIRWGEDGALYVAGLRPTPGFELGECLRRPICDAGFVVARIDPGLLTTTEVLRSEGIKGAFGAATTALEMGGRLWISTFRGDRLAIVTLKR